MSPPDSRPTKPSSDSVLPDGSAHGRRATATATASPSKSNTPFLVAAPQRGSVCKHSEHAMPATGGWRVRRGYPGRKISFAEYSPHPWCQTLSWWVGGRGENGAHRVARCCRARSLCSETDPETVLEVARSDGACPISASSSPHPTDSLPRNTDKGTPPAPECPAAIQILPRPKSI